MRGIIIIAITLPVLGLVALGCSELLPPAAPGTEGPYTSSEFREIHDYDESRFREMQGLVTVVGPISRVAQLPLVPGRYSIILGEKKRGEFFVFQHVTCYIDDQDGSKGLAELREGEGLAIVGIPARYSPGAIVIPNASAPSLEDCDLSPN